MLRSFNEPFLKNTTFFDYFLVRNLLIRIDSLYSYIKLKKMYVVNHVNFKLIKFNKYILFSKFSTKSIPSIGLFGVNEDRNSSFLKGCRKAPAIIRESLYSSAFNTTSENRIDIAPHIKDFGDVISKESSHKSLACEIDPIIDKIFKEKLNPVIIGGDHSISYSLVKSIKRYLNNKPFIIVHFDAHPDIYDNFEDNKYSHASPFARICEDNGLITQLISIGIRTASKEQLIQMERFDVKTIEAKDFPSKGIDIEFFLKKYINDNDNVYISLDIDVLEPGICPGVSHREAGGLSSRQLIDAIHIIPGNIIGGDIVEYNPDRDIDNISASIASKLLKELCSKIISSKERNSV